MVSFSLHSKSVLNNSCEGMLNNFVANLQVNTFSILLLITIIPGIPLLITGASLDNETFLIFRNGWINNYC